MKTFRNFSALLGNTWPRLTEAWEAWGIQLMVALSLGCQIFLVLYGGRRRYKRYTFQRYVILGAYLFASSIISISLGNLSTFQIGKHRPDYQTELKGLLAPLLLMHLANPDNITAYSVEDNSLGLRLMVNCAVSFVFVIWILLRCMDTNSPISALYIPLSVAGFIRLAEMFVWALKLGQNEKVSTTVKQLRDAKIDTDSFKKVEPLREDSVLKDRFLQQIVKAYYRFKCLRPHLENWLYSPKDISDSWLSLEHKSTLSTFITTEVELSFVFDALYTRAPLLYTMSGLAFRFATLLCLVATLCGFAFIFKSAFLVDMYVAYTYALLILEIILEGYQIMLMLFSEWAVVMIYNLQRGRQDPVQTTRCSWLMKKLLPFLSKRCMKQKRWSNLIGQLNLFDHRHYKDCPQPWGSPSRLLDKKQKLWLRSYLVHTSRKIPRNLKDLLRRELEKLEKKRDQLPFDKRGEWTLEACKVKNDVHDVLWSSIKVAFDKSIILWHLATEICYSTGPEDSDQNREGSKLLSDYMMYLTCFHPYALSLTTTYITMDHAYSKLRDGGREALLTRGVVETDKENDSEGTIITREWHVLSDAEKLAAALKKLDTPVKWQVISSMWVEMLCFAAYNCQIYYHAKMLRIGGELITHVWLQLLHNTDKLKARPDPNTSQDPSTSSSRM